MNENPYEPPTTQISERTNTTQTINLLLAGSAVVSSSMIATAVGFLLSMSIAIHGSPWAILSTPNFRLALRQGIVCGLVSIIPALMATFAVERRFQVAVAFATSSSLAVVTSMGYYVWISLQLG